MNFFPLDTWQKFVSRSNSVVLLLVLTNNIARTSAALSTPNNYIIVTTIWITKTIKPEKKKEYLSNGENRSLPSFKVYFKKNWLSMSWNGFLSQDWKINVTESQSCTKFLQFQNLKSLSARGTYQSKEYRKSKEEGTRKIL